jgi:integrase
MTPRALPPGARWITLPNGDRRVELVIDQGRTSSGKRRQYRRRFRTTEAARDFYAETRHDVKRGTHVARERETTAAAVAEWLAGRRNIRPTTLAGYSGAVGPLLFSYGDTPVQQLTKADIDQLVSTLLRGDHPAQRRPWRPRTANMLLFVLRSVLDDLVKQGRLARNVAALVDRPSGVAAQMPTWTGRQVEAFLATVAGSRMEAAWLLALHGLRRGEIAGLRWCDVDLDRATLTVQQTRVSVGGTALTSAPKSERSLRTLPLTRDLERVLRDTRKRQSADRLAAGAAYSGLGYVVVDELGQPLHPDTITSRWVRTVADAWVPRIRLHDARHTCATLLHLRGVPTAVIAAWLGHASAAFTLRTYAHAQDDALRDAATTLGEAFSRPDVTSA